MEPINGCRSQKSRRKQCGMLLYQNCELIKKGGRVSLLKYTKEHPIENRLRNPADMNNSKKVGKINFKLIRKLLTLQDQSNNQPAFLTIGMMGVL